MGGEPEPPIDLAVDELDEDDAGDAGYRRQRRPSSRRQNHELPAHADDLVPLSVEIDLALERREPSCVAEPRLDVHAHEVDDAGRRSHHHDGVTAGEGVVTIAIV